MRTFVWSFLPLVLLASLSALAAQPQVERLSSPPPATPKAIIDTLQAQGYGVMSADGSPLARIWLRNNLPVSGRKEVEGANYPALSPGILLGVIEFAAPARDFRKQAVKPGVYAMRYELLPDDGNHMGVAPDRDFILLVSMADDPGPSAVLPYAELTKLSNKASGTNHPAVFSMPAADRRSLPAAYVDANDYVVFAAGLHTSVGELPIAVILKGVSTSI